jgi:hypothetical protein
MVSSSLYDSLKTADSSKDSRVEVNQRALIDKILARYASAGAVYRELLQNSNDAEATRAEILFSVEGDVVTSVTYRNNGMPFRPQDWDRLQKIAEGNPDEKKVGAFGVGAYTMFSICEEPMVVSGTQALLFVWKGDALWTKIVEHETRGEWTTFILPSRDPYSMPNLVEFGQFLCANLTFTQCLRTIRVLVNNEEQLCINKSTLQPPRIVTPPKSSSWWKNDGAVTTSPTGIFTLGDISEEIQQILVVLQGNASTIKARYVSGTARTCIPAAMVKRMERVTKKKPPKQVTVQIYISAEEREQESSHSGASSITAAFSPKMGAGRVFIGFRTSQTTGLAAHLAAPLIPTVEREAIDMQDPTLKVYNTELLDFAGILMRLTLEHSMSLIGDEWIANTKEREALEVRLLKEGVKEAELPAFEKQESSVSDTDDTGSSLMTFAKFMTKGVKKKIVSVLNSVDALVDDGSAELLNPRDPRPLSIEERHAILLMRSFCPQQSTPDTTVGAALAQGFSRCMSTVLPPVLSKSGIVRGNDARLPHRGIEAFCQANVVREIVYRNAEEYHEVLARCRRLTIDDLTSTLAGQVMLEDQVVRLIQWWTKFCRLEANVASRGFLLKESVRFLPKEEAEVMHLKPLKNFLYYVDHKTLPEGLPMPPSVLTKEMQEAVTTRTLSDFTLKNWFSPLPIEVWAEFISHHHLMVAGQPEDEKVRTLALRTLSKEHGRRSATERLRFANLCNGLLRDKRCIPFDSHEPAMYAAERPGDLYLNSAELKAFDGIGSSFNKVSQSVIDAEVTEEFLLALGVRKSVAIDFLFTNLETLRWRDDPKALIEYLRSASLTKQDTDMLRTTQYLPAENDLSRTFAPAELYLPNPELRVFSFVSLLQWPSDDELTERTANGKFLTRLGCNVHPPLSKVLQYMSDEKLDDDVRIRCLGYVAKNLGPDGVYETEYMRLRSSKAVSNSRFLPCIRNEEFESGDPKRELHAPNDCYSDQTCMKMGFPVLRPDLEKKNGRLYASCFQCKVHPDPDLLVSQLLRFVRTADAKLKQSRGDEYKKLCSNVLVTFDEIFSYLSTRSTEFSSGQLRALATEKFIPCKVKDVIEWYEPADVYFKNSTKETEDSLTEALFQVIDFSPFLAAAGVQSEARTQDIFRLMLSSPDKVLATLGSEAKYRALLRRIAANPPFQRVTPMIRNAPFLLAYKIQEDDEGDGEVRANFLLSKAEDIYIIDNSFLGRMFPVIRSPHESDLEDFYNRLGSSYISKKVNISFEVIARHTRDTALTMQLAQRIKERSPLLVSPSVTSRPLVSNASSILDDKNLYIVEAVDLKAVYALGDSVRNQRVSCCAKPTGNRKNSLYITENFDIFDVGTAIGGLILQRCQLEDAFFIGSLLEAPLEQLRARGFPVDRILRPPEPLAPEPSPVKPALTTIKAGTPSSMGASDAATVPTSNASNEAKAAPGSQNRPASDEGFESIFKQMFPDCTGSYVRSRLGPNPSLDDVQRLAEEMSSGNYPKNGSTSASPPPQPLTPVNGKNDKRNSALPDHSSALNEAKKGKLGKRLGRALSGIRGSSSTAVSPQTPQAVSAPMLVPQVGTAHHDKNPVPPERDSASHSNMEQMLRKKVEDSSKVNVNGINSPETILLSLPEGLERGNDGCEVIPGQSLKAFNGQYRTDKTSNGIRVFSSRNKPESEAFLLENFHAVDSFADVLQKLCGVYELDLNTVAIFHDSSGGTIAFNANRALYFNVRFFYALHYKSNQPAGRDCYSYWFTTMAHELAHHLGTTPKMCAATIRLSVFDTHRPPNCCVF